jgi:hypothetical protein
MKKILIFSISLMALGTMMYSCNPADECKNCEVVTYDKNTGKELNRSSATEYCGASLTAVEHQAPVIIGDEKTVYECK